ncbi:MAG: hypothetical protein QOD94_3148 [Alphaproteobacteria bacterium]|nr:hypothetical protein [Alphaproteobacteria bacterium]
MTPKHLWTGCFVSVLSLTLMADFAQAQTITAASPSIKSDVTMGEAARAAMTRGRLLMNTADAALKQAATDAALLEDASRSAPSELTPQDGGGDAKAPVIVGGHSFAGQSATMSSPPASTGAIGPFSYIQTVNMSVTIYNRTTNAVIATGTLNQLADNAATVDSFDAQINWDASTNRFYYVMDSVFSYPTNNKLAFGFSKTSNPANVTTDWCHYLYTPGDPARFPYFPKLGDSLHFMIIGVNSFKPYIIPGGTFVGADLIAISKPPAGTTCPTAATFKKATRLSLKDTAGKNVFAPVPANQIDSSSTGYVMARNGTLPSNRLWFFSVTRNATGFPVFGSPRGLNVPSYTIPPAASQPTFGQLLDTLDARPTQAVQAVNPDRGTFSFWVQHTVKQDALNLAEVRWYEINPVPALPVLLRSGKINNTKSHVYNAAISPDRRKDGATVAFGDSFVIQYNVSGRASAISPRIVAGSSFNGGALSFALIKNAVGPYRDFTCPNPGDVCRWGDHWGAAPDPRPTTRGRGEVWITNQYSGLVNPPKSTANFRTWISAVQP